MKSTEKSTQLLLALCVAALVFTAGCAQQAQEGNNNVTVVSNTETEIKVVQNPTFGQILVDGRGMTLYTLKEDEAGNSTCYDQCAINWPPLTAEVEVSTDLSGDIGTTARKDGKKQATYKGMPLYYFAQDKKAGDVNGEGFKGVWFAAGPRPTLTTTTKGDAAETTQKETTEAGSSTATTAGGPKKTEVAIKSFAFSPEKITITAGDTVVWTNMDSAPHTVTSEPGSSVKELDSERLARGDSYSHTFETAGTYSYHCGIHTSMRGKVFVQPD